MNEKIATVTCVFLHPTDDRVRFRLEEAEACFGEFTSSPAQSTNVPDSAPPEIERIVLQGTKKRVALSKSLSQATFNFEDSNKSASEVMEICVANAHKFHAATKKFHGGVDFTENGLVLVLRYPAANKESTELVPFMNNAMADKFYVGERFGPAHTFDLKVGFLTGNNLYRSVLLNTYESRGGMVLGGQMVNISSLPLLETGIQLSLDVNDKPRKGVGVKFEDVLEDLIGFFGETSYRKIISSFES